MITAIVPARSGSKRLPNKNIKQLNGKPLLFYTLDAVISHPEITQIIFTSESKDYIDLVDRNYNRLVQSLIRPEEFASDSSKVYDEILRLKSNSLIENDWFMVCLPTAPLRSHDTIERLLALWREDRLARFSAALIQFPIQFGFDIDRLGNWIPCFPDSPMITGATRSQDIPKRYRPTGAIYLQKTEMLGEAKTFYTNAKPFLTSPVESLDVDTLIDFKVVEAILKELQSDNR